MPSKILTILLVLTILSINHLVDAGNKKGDSGGVVSIEPTIGLRNTHDIILLLNRKK